MGDAANGAGEELLLAQHRARVDRALARIAAQCRGVDDVSAALRYALETGGKRLRPILALCAMEAVRGGNERAGDARGGDERRGDGRVPVSADGDDPLARAAAAVELVHTYSLVHDDLPCMDDDDLRRGRPTAHRVHGVHAAMLAGFALIPFACRVLVDAAADAGIPPDRRMAAVRELCSGAGASGMVGGQVLDLEGERAEPGLEGLHRIHRMKTGALFRAALRTGAVLAGADEPRMDALGRFGERLGLAFQITDDVLDVTMDAAALGKTPGKDVASGKTTFVSLLGLEGARAAAVAESDAAVALLEGAGTGHPLLYALARVAVQRDR